jgi:hypothetical protein
MKTRIAIMLVLVLTAACSSIKVSYDYDKQADFTKYKTYKIADEVRQSGINQLDLDRIIRAVEKELEARGFTKSDTPDALVDFHVKLQQQQTATATNHGAYGMYGGYGPYRYGFSPGFSTTTIDVNTYVEGTLFVNLVDTELQKIVWQGRGTKTLDEHASAEKREANINKALSYIFQKYPVPATSDKKK